VTLTPVLSVEAGGRVVRGLALPFNQPALVLEDDGSVVAEVMDDQAIDALPGTVPLLVGHSRAAPAVGVVRTFGIVPGKGVGVEAELAVNDQDLDTWRRRFACWSVYGAEYRVPVRQASHPLGASRQTRRPADEAATRRAD
jgi:hypothetical protein